MKIAIAKLFIIIILASCGFTSGLYEDILEAQELTSKHKFKEASALYKKILLKKPALNVKTKVYYQLAEIDSIFLNRPEEAIEYYNKVIKISSDPLWHVKSIEKIAKINFESLKKYKEAINSYSKLLKFRPKLERNDYYSFKIAMSYFYLKNFSLSEMKFKNLISNSKLYESYNYLALINYYRSNWGKAVDYWFEYLKREKNKNKVINTKYLIANAYESNEELKKAYNIYYSLLGDYPNQEVLKKRLKSIYERRVARKRWIKKILESLLR